jgi:hypothetical protein
MATSTTKKASRSGNPAKRAASVSAGPTSASQWKTGNSGPFVEDVLLPSGNVARVRRIGPEAFLTQGIIPDPLTGIVQEAVSSKKGLKPKQQKELLEDPKQIGAVLEMMDRVLCYAVVEPLVQMPPACVICGEYNTSSVKEHQPGDSDFHLYRPADREEDVLYADIVDLDDKAFVLNYCIGGTRDLERFRAEFGAAVASLDSVEDAGE